VTLHDAGDENLCLSQLVENQEGEVGKRPGSKLSQSRGGSALVPSADLRVLVEERERPFDRVNESQRDVASAASSR
jgi:hypothetical protein